MRYRWDVLDVSGWSFQRGHAGRQVLSFHRLSNELEGHQFLDSFGESQYYKIQMYKLSFLYDILDSEIKPLQACSANVAL